MRRGEKMQRERIKEVSPCEFPVCKIEFLAKYKFREIHTNIGKLADIYGPLI